MRKPGTDPQNVQMTDVLCDFCRREWTEDLPLIEGHQGSCMCGNCLTLAYAAVVLHGENSAPAEFRCPMCLETAADRKELDRGDEPGWQSPLNSEAVVCLRCIELAAKALERDRDWNWTRPTHRD
jgi:hypothetical protein